jgi:hypothetical protein
MAQFNKDELTNFLGIVRKYMQVRGGLNQKELSEITDTSVSTISRPQLIAKLVAKLEIPLHEIIDFVEEDYTEKFKRLVRFYKDDEEGDPEDLDGDLGAELESGQKTPDPLDEAMGTTGTARKTVNAKVRVGKRTTNLPFIREEEGLSFKDKISRLSPRQKAYITDFLNLDVEGRDLVVDLGNSLFRYFKQKGVEF